MTLYNNFDSKDELARAALEKFGGDSLTETRRNIAGYLRAVADREAFYGDPNFVDVPLDRMTSPEYADDRAATTPPDNRGLGGSFRILRPARRAR